MSEPFSGISSRIPRRSIGCFAPISTRGFRCWAQQALLARRFSSERPRLLLVDGFAGPGSYAEGEPGSPLIMLHALLSHSAFDRFEGVDFIFLFIEHDERRVEHLEGRLLHSGRFHPMCLFVSSPGSLSRRLDRYSTRFRERRRLVPTFAFIDPFGYSSASMSLAGRLLDFPRCEVLSSCRFVRAPVRGTGGAGERSELAFRLRRLAWP